MARPQPQGDPTASKSERTRERIVDAAAQVLTRRGYAGTRLSDIADVAQVQAPAIYYYFASRDELIEEAVAVGLGRARALVTEALADAPADASPLDRIDVAVHAHLQTLLTHSAHAAAAIRTVPQLPEEIRARQREAQGSYVAIWRDLIADARDAGALDPVIDVRAVLMVIVGALNWTVEWWDPGRGSLEDLTRTAQRLVRSGLAAG